MTSCMTQPTKLFVCSAMIDQLGQMPQEKSRVISLPVKTLNRLSEGPDWSQFSLGMKFILYGFVTRRLMFF